MSFERDIQARERAVELLCDRALVGLDGDESLELDRLLLRFPELDDPSYDLAAATIESIAPSVSASVSASADAATIPVTFPERLRRDMVAAGESWVARHVPRSAPAPSNAEAWSSSPHRSVSGANAPGSSGRGSDVGRTATSRAVGAQVGAGVGAGVGAAIGSSGTVAGGGSVWAIGGWLAAAAALVIATVAWLPMVGRHQTPAATRAELIATAPDLMKLDWAEHRHALVEDFLCGDVVWSDQAQRGYLTITGLRPNDPAQFQYQLWIFDATRDAAFPVDGGVFDVPASDRIDMVIVPFTPRVPVGEATMFAVTVEPPGGVVVSKRDIALLAKR